MKKLVTGLVASLIATAFALPTLANDNDFAQFANQYVSVGITGDKTIFNCQELFLKDAKDWRSLTPKEDTGVSVCILQNTSIGKTAMSMTFPGYNKND